MPEIGPMVKERFTECPVSCFSSLLVSLFKETLIQSLPDFTLGFLYRARNHLTRIASYLRMMMTKPCIKIHVEADSAIESAFP